MSDDFAERLAGRVQNLRETQLRNHGIVDVEQQLVAVALGFGVRKKRLVLPPANRRSGAVGRRASGRKYLLNQTLAWCRNYMNIYCQTKG